MTSSRFKHPILHLHVLGGSGVERSEHRVFCRLQRRSIAVEDCCSCFHCDDITDGETATVNCTMPIAPDDPAADPRGEETEIGTLLCSGTVVLTDRAPLRDAFALMQSADRRSVAIVDDRSALIGIVHETGFIGRRVIEKEIAISAAMSSALALHERTPVRVALRFLAANHLREATVVSDDGVPIGTFRDIDGLDWIRVARDGSTQRE